LEAIVKKTKKVLIAAATTILLLAVLLSGCTSPQNTQGERGEQGVQGTQGLKGETGERGLQGLQGLKGDKGDKGNTGPVGPQGEQGLQGNPGLSWGSPVTTTRNIPGLPVNGGAGMPISVNPGDRVTFSYISSNYLLCEARDPYNNTLFQCIKTYADYGSLSGQGAFIAAVQGNYYIAFTNKYQDYPTGTLTYTIYPKQ